MTTINNHGYAVQSWSLPRSLSVHTKFSELSVGQVERGTDSLVIDAGDAAYVLDCKDVVLAKASNGAIDSKSVANASAEIRAAMKEKGSLSGQELAERGIVGLVYSQELSHPPRSPLSTSGRRRGIWLPVTCELRLA